MQLAMIQDKIVPINNVDAVYFDRGTYFGDGVYEVLRSYNGKIFALDEHLERFANSLAAIQITHVDINEIHSRVLKAFDTAKIPNAKIYFHITRGSGPRNHTCSNDIKPNFFLTISELHDSPETKTKGIAVSTYPDLRWKRCDIKSLNLLANVLARMDAEKKNCDEAIFVDDTGLITEGAASAFFAVIGKNLQTAPLTANILSSVTRRYVIKAANNIGLKVVEKSLTPKQATNADELFTAVTTRDIIPVAKFDGHIIGNSIPGHYTKLLCSEFQKFIT